MTATAKLATKSTTTTEQTASPISGKVQSRVLGATRLVISLLFVLHGVVGMWGAWGGNDTMGGSAALFSWPDWWASLIHLVAGAFVFSGLLTRWAALLCSGAMAFAYFTVHLPLGFVPLANGGELAVMFSWIFLLIAVVGPGAFALDNLRRRRR